MRGLGTIINVAAVILGGGLWHALKGGLKERFQQILMQAPWGMHHFIGISGALKGMLRVENGHTGSYGHHASHRVPGDRFSSRGMDSDRKMDGSFSGEWLREKVGGKMTVSLWKAVSASLIICVEPWPL